MHCPSCTRDRPSRQFACHRCITTNLRTFRKRHSESLQKTSAALAQVEAALAARQPAVTEAAQVSGQVGHIRREVAYVERQRAAGKSPNASPHQAKLDDLQNRIARRRQALDTARRALSDYETQLGLARQQVRARRKAWRAVHEETVQWRQARVRTCLDLFLVCERGEGGYEIGGLRIPHLLSCHDLLPEELLFSLERVTALVHLCSAYLGIVLPFLITPADTDAVMPRIALQAAEEPITLGLHMNTLDQGDYLAALLINVRALSSPATFELDDIEIPLGKWLVDLIQDSQLGIVSDASALHYIRSKPAAEIVLAAWARRITAEQAVVDVHAWEQVDFADIKEAS